MFKNYLTRNNKILVLRAKNKKFTFLKVFLCLFVFFFTTTLIYDFFNWSTLTKNEIKIACFFLKKLF